MRNRIVRKLAKITPMLLVSLFIGMQLLPTPGVSKTPIPRSQTADRIDPQIGRILNRSCQDCHSNRTAWPWYSHVAPVSWVISKHVIQGREVLDFSNWATQPPSEGERMLICEAVSEGTMPLRDYTAIHRRARLSKQDVKMICDWADAPLAHTALNHDAKLTNNNH